MIPVKRPDLTDEEWRDWRKNALLATDDLVKQYDPGEDVAVEKELYRPAMPFLLRLSNEKCAYCESVITSNHPGDVEHYRPKGRIRDKDGKIVMVQLDGKEVPHPGYWWLAYEWSNMLPSCIDCNRRRNHTDGSAGKADCFAINGKRAVLPQDDITGENPLLLDPSAEGFESTEHFEFHEDGSVKPLTDRALYSCDLLGLNVREQLKKQREEAYVTARSAITTWITSLGTGSDQLLKSTAARINAMWAGRTQYSAFARRALEVTVAEWQSKGARVELPLP